MNATRGTGTRLLGKVVVVTGAAEAAAPAREGARVIATDALPADGCGQSSVVCRLPSAVCRLLDLTSPDDWAERAAEIRESYGEVHGMVNNAGVTWRARLDEVRREDFERVYAVNVTGPLMRLGASIVDVGRPPSHGPLPGRLHHGGVTAHGGVKFPIRRPAAAVRPTVSPLWSRCEAAAPGGRANRMAHFAEPLPGTGRWPSEHTARDRQVRIRPR